MQRQASFYDGIMSFEQHIVSNSVKFAPNGILNFLTIRQ